MRVLMRLAVAVLIAVLGSIEFAVTPSAVGPGGGPPTGSANPPAGSYQTTSLRASFNFAGASPADPQGNIIVTDTTNVSDPKVGAATTTTETDLSISIFSPTQNFGCFALTKAGDFSVSGGLAGAVLNTTIDQSTPGCTGFPPNAFPALPLNVSVTWALTGPVATGRDSAEFTCGSYTADSVTTTKTNVGSATASLTPLLTNPVSGLAGIGSSDQRIHADGVSLDACQAAFGGGPGVGFGPQPPGTYRFVNMQAGGNLETTSGLQVQVGLSVSKFTNTFQPKGGTPTATSGINLQVFVSGAAGFGFMCFVIPSADFTSTGVQGAALHTAIDSTTPLCPNGPAFGTIPLPMNIAATWTSAGPISNLSEDTSYSCDKFGIRGQNTTASSNDKVTATFAPAFTDTFTTNQGSLFTGDQQTEIKGVQPLACLVRG